MSNPAERAREAAAEVLKASNGADSYRGPVMFATADELRIAADELERLSDIALERGEALERARGCIKGLLARTPVRDVAEMLAEIDHVLRGTEGEGFGK